MTKVAPKRNPITKKNLFYPGAGYDFSTLIYFMHNSDIANFYFCDYHNTEYTEASVFNNIKLQFSSAMLECEIKHLNNLYPQFYKQNDWSDFWHEDQDKMNNFYIDNSFVSIFEIKSGSKKWFLYYFGTEAIKTYQVLLNNNIHFDVVVTQDHCLGGLWTTFCRGSKLEILSIFYNKMPNRLMVGENQEPWENYRQISQPFGMFGLHEHPRVLFEFN